MAAHTGSSIFSGRFRTKFGEADVADIVDLRQMRRASGRDVATTRAGREAAPHEPTPTPITSVDGGEWRGLAERAVEPNGYYLPDWELAVNATAPGRTGAGALSAFGDNRLIGLMPVVPLARAAKIPLPALASAHPYGPLCTPRPERELPEQAASHLVQAARDGGARAMPLRATSPDGAPVTAFHVLPRGKRLP